MSVATWNQHRDDTPGIVSLDGSRADRTVRIVREILSAHGLHESRGVADEGFYFEAEGASEITIAYNGVETKRDAGLLTCCQAMSQSGFTLTLFLSARTSALFIRTG